MKQFNLNEKSNNEYPLKNCSNEKIKSLIKAYKSANNSVMKNSSIRKLNGKKNLLNNDDDYEIEYEVINYKDPNSNGMIGDYLKNNKNYNKNTSYERQNSETNNPNTENFNTNINSVSGLGKNLASNKELNLSNIKQDNQNNSNNNNNYNSIKNFNHEKLILRENCISANSMHKKTSNPSLNRYNTLSRFSKKQSNNDVSIFDTHGSIKFGKKENEGVDYREFIVSEEKDILGNNYNSVRPKLRMSGKFINISIPIYKL